SVILTSIEDVATAGDLMNRSVLIELPVIESQQRKPKRALLDRWEAVRPRVLGALLDALADAMRILPVVALAEHPRMADFARLAVAAGPALGYTEEAFLDAYQGNEQAGHQLALEESPLTPVLNEWLDGRHGQPWQGTSGELLAVLNGIAKDDI